MLKFSTFTFSGYIKKVKRERVYIHNIDLLLMPEILFNWLTSKFRFVYPPKFVGMEKILRIFPL